MRLNIYFGLLVAMLTSLSIHSYGQETVRNKPEVQQQKEKQERGRYYRQALQIDSAKADQISIAQDSYKEGLKAVMADTTLNDGARRIRIQQLMEVKNQRLRLLLNAEQQKKLIPSTERRSKDKGTNQ